MSSLTVQRPRASPTGTAVGHHLRTHVPGALLVFAVMYIHVKDQGGFPGEKTPSYVGIGYYLLEGAALLVALVVLARSRRTAR